MVIFATMHFKRIFDSLKEHTEGPKTPEPPHRFFAPMFETVHS
jgi:hypothetical protein